jgi:tRNA(Glu) U13 pseudouridine synthase TruD
MKLQNIPLPIPIRVIGQPLQPDPTNTGTKEGKMDDNTKNSLDVEMSVDVNGNTGNVENSTANTSVDTKIDGTSTNNKEEDTNNIDPLIAMRIGFTLPSSSYATMFLRELMKRPTSSEYQSQLTFG